MEGSKEEEIKQVIKDKGVAQKPIVDVVFVMDCTGSMASFIKSAKNTIKNMISTMKENYSESSVFVGFVGYRDHCDEKLLESHDLTGDMEEIFKFIETLKATGGGDCAEAVADGLHEAAYKISWREEDSLRIVVLVCDAPPHGKEFKCSSDDHPGGCPCGISYIECLKKLDSLNTQFMILNFTPEVKTMIDIFSANHKNTINISIKNENGCVEYGEDSCDDDESISGSDSEEGEDIKKCAILKEECYDSCSEEEEAKPKPKKEKKLKKKEIPTSSKGLSSAKKMEEEIALRVSSLAKSKWGSQSNINFTNYITHFIFCFNLLLYIITYYIFYYIL